MARLSGSGGLLGRLGRRGGPRGIFDIGMLRHKRRETMIRIGDIWGSEERVVKIVTRCIEEGCRCLHSRGVYMESTDEVPDGYSIEIVVAGSEGEGEERVVDFKV